MAKRIVTKIGDVFCIEIDNLHKRFFQYICNDLSCMNSSVIRVFRERYPMEYKPVLSEIIKGNIEFYAHTVLKPGIEDGVWYKIGKINSTDTNIQNIIWGTTDKYKIVDCRTTIEINPMQNWTIWQTNGNRIFIGSVPLHYYNQLENGMVKNNIDIVRRVRLGYYTYTSPIYDIIKRIPYPDVDSYTKKEFEDKIVWSHFRGEFVVQEIVVKEDGETILSEGNPLDRPKFWQTNWKYQELITKEDFNDVWNKP